MSAPSSLVDLLGERRYNFLDPGRAEVERLLPDVADRLPRPRVLAIASADRPPLVGFPILESRGLMQLEESLEAALRCEEEAQVAYAQRDSFDSRAFASRWDEYRGNLGRVLENVVRSSYGDDTATIFWLAHSALVADWIRDVPRRLRRDHHSVGRDHGDTIKYRILEKWSDRVTAFVFDLSRELGDRLGEPEDCLFPQILSVLRDNVLILSEEHLSPDLSELSSYFQAHLGQEGRDLRKRLKAWISWHTELLRKDGLVSAAYRDLWSEDPAQAEGRLPRHAGLLSFLAAHPSWDAARLPDARQIRLWESLLFKVQQFELLQALRRLVLRLRESDDGYAFQDRTSTATWAGGPPTVHVSPSVRPMDFAASWVVDPLVRRFGLVYDISDFSATLSMLGRVEKTKMDEAFETTFLLQRRINRIAGRLGLRLEKYLGDGAFYSSLEARPMLALAVELQRLYAGFVADGYQFDSGLRIALNFGEYRLLPLDDGREERASRYEYFGHGLVELSRLTTGKKTQELDEFKTYLVGQGYPEPTVNKFFAPILRGDTELVSREEESRQFYAYINPNHTLINEGIVATETFLDGLGDLDRLWYYKEDGRGYVVCSVRDERGEDCRVGVRKLGLGRFKGLDPLPIYEVVDGRGWDPSALRTVPRQNLLQATEKVFASLRVAGR